MKQFYARERPSWRGICLRELIAAGVKLSGGNVLESAGKRKVGNHSKLHPLRGYQLERISLPDGANADYLVPHECTRKDIAILYLHGGGYVIGYMPVFQRRSVKLAGVGGQVPVLSLDYRIAPEHPYPAALDDAVRAVEWLKQEQGIAPESVIAIGESAGAGLALALAMRLRDSGKGLLRALVLMSPWTDLTCRGESYAERYSMDPVFGRRNPQPADDARTIAGQPYIGSHDPTDPYISPAFGDFNSLPPMLVHVGENEMLFDDAMIVYKKVKAAGGQVQFKIWPGMFHTFQMADGLIPEARTAWREIGEYVREQFKSEGRSER